MKSRSLLLGLVASAACMPPAPPPAPPIPPVSTGKVRVRVFTETSPARLIAAAGHYLFVGTDNDLERWDRYGRVSTLSAENGLSGSHVAALASDSERAGLWILTEGGLGHYDASAELYSEMPPPPASVGVDFGALAKEPSVSVAPAEDGGAWLGTQHGLFSVTPQDGWAATSIKDPIRALARDRDGWLWVAAKGGLIARKPAGDIVKIAAGQGLAIVEPRLVVELSGGRMLVIGSDGDGHDRIAIGAQLVWTTYRALPETHWDAAAVRGDGAVIMGDSRVYRLAPAAAAHIRPLARDGMRLVTAGGPATDWVIDPVDVVVPPGAMTVSTVDDHLLIGTRDLGTARYRDGDAQPRDWLRRKAMFDDATTLSVACARAQDCWIATGARQAWHWTGDKFAAGGPDQVVLAVTRDLSGAIFALHRDDADDEIHLSRIDGATWTAMPKVALTTPGTRPEVSFARFAPSGALWVGLRHHTGDAAGDDRRGDGIAIVDPGTGKTIYHRTSDDDEPADRKHALAVPPEVFDGDLRGDSAWLATDEGVAQLSRGELKLWTEAEGVLQPPRSVSIAPSGDVIIATSIGAGIWNGASWEFPAALRFDINDAVATRSGQLWMATDRGVAAWDGKKLRRVDMLRGLAENRIVDIAADQFDRVWARGPGSLTLISQ